MTPSPATKAAAISDYLAGKGGYFQIALEYGISPYTLKKWVESPEKALNQSSQKGIIELESSKSEYTGLIERNELKSEEPEFKTKDAEIRYLRDKIAYLETLSELMGYNPNHVAKKNRFECIQHLLRSGRCTNVTRLCTIAGVSKQCYYEYIAGREKVNPDAELIQIIGKIQTQLDYSVGYRQMTKKLVSMGHNVNHKKISRIMRENGLNSVVRRKKYSPEVYERRRLLRESVPENILQRNFFSATPRSIFVTDITYLYTSDGVYYLNIIEDLYNREIVAWKIGASPDSYLCIETVRLLAESVDLTDTIIHSDQGSSYTSYDYQDFLVTLGIKQSCSDVGECWDNAAMETFNSILKTEGFYAKWTKKRFKECKIPSQEVFEQVRNFILYYNNFRIKKDLGDISPTMFLEKFPFGKNKG